MPCCLSHARVDPLAQAAWSLETRDTWKEKESRDAEAAALAEQERLRQEAVERALNAEKVSKGIAEAEEIRRAEKVQAEHEAALRRAEEEIWNNQLKQHASASQRTSHEGSTTASQRASRRPSHETSASRLSGEGEASSNPTPPSSPQLGATHASSPLAHPSPFDEQQQHDGAYDGARAGISATSPGRPSFRRQRTVGVATALSRRPSHETSASRLSGEGEASSNASVQGASVQATPIGSPMKRRKPSCGTIVYGAVLPTPNLASGEPGDGAESGVGMGVASTDLLEQILAQANQLPGLERCARASADSFLSHGSGASALGLPLGGHPLGGHPLGGHSLGGGGGSYGRDFERRPSSSGGASVFAGGGLRPLTAVSYHARRSPPPGAPPRFVVSHAAAPSPSFAAGAAAGLSYMRGEAETTLLSTSLSSGIGSEPGDAVSGYKPRHRGASTQQLAALGDARRSAAALERVLSSPSLTREKLVGGKVVIPASRPSSGLHHPALQGEAKAAAVFVGKQAWLGQRKVFGEGRSATQWRYSGGDLLAPPR